MVEQRKSSVLVELLTAAGSPIIIFEGLSPLSNTFFFRLLGLNVSDSSIDSSDVLVQDIFHFWRTQFCLYGYELNIFATQQLRAAVATLPLSHTQYRLLPFTLMVFQKHHAYQQYKEHIYNNIPLSLVNGQIISPVNVATYHTMSTDDQRLVQEIQPSWQAIVQKESSAVITNRLKADWSMHPISSTNAGTSISHRLHSSDVYGHDWLCWIKFDRPAVTSNNRTLVYAQLFNMKQYDKLALLLLHELERTAETVLNSPVNSAALHSLQSVITPFLREFLFYFSRPQFVVNRRWCYSLLFVHHKLTVLLRLSDLGNADAFIINNTLPIFNLLMLYSPLSSLSIPVSTLYDRDVLFTAYWLAQCVEYALNGGTAQKASR